MRNSSGHQCKVKLSGSEKKWTGTRTTFPSWNVQLRTFWKFHSVVVQNNGKEMYKKSVLLVQSCFCNLGLLVFFTVFQRCIPSLLSITPLYSGTPRAECASGASWVNKSTYPRKFGNHVTDRPTDRPSAPQAYQCLLSHFLATLGAQEKADCTSMLSSIDSCQNRVSADQYHLTVSRAQVSTHQGRVFFWSYPQVYLYFFLKFMSNMSCLCQYRPALLRFWFQTDRRCKNSASFFV